MSKGRKKTPTAILKLRGSRAVRGDELVVPPSMLACPKGLDKIAREEWDRLALELFNMGVLTFMDKAALEMYCECYSRWKKAKSKVDKLGEVIKTKTGLTQNPYLRIACRALDQMKSILPELGFTPASRARLTNPTKKEAKGIEAEFFNG